MSVDERRLQQALDDIDDARAELRTHRRVIVAGIAAWFIFVGLFTVGCAMGDEGGAFGIPGTIGTLVVTFGLPAYLYLGDGSEARKRLRKAERKYRDLTMGWE